VIENFIYDDHFIENLFIMIQWCLSTCGLTDGPIKIEEFIGTVENETVHVVTVKDSIFEDERCSLYSITLRNGKYKGRYIGILQFGNHWTQEQRNVYAERLCTLRRKFFSTEQSRTCILEDNRTGNIIALAEYKANDQVPWISDWYHYEVDGDVNLLLQEGLKKGPYMMHECAIEADEFLFILLEKIGKLVDCPITHFSTLPSFCIAFLHECEKMKPMLASFLVLYGRINYKLGRYHAALLCFGSSKDLQGSYGDKELMERCQLLTENNYKPHNPFQINEKDDLIITLGKSLIGNATIEFNLDDPAYPFIHASEGSHIIEIGIEEEVDLIIDKIKSDEYLSQRFHIKAIVCDADTVEEEPTIAAYCDYVFGRPRMLLYPGVRILERLPIPNRNILDFPESIMKIHEDEYTCTFASHNKMMISVAEARAWLRKKVTKFGERIFRGCGTIMCQNNKSNTFPYILYFSVIHYQIHFEELGEVPGATIFYFHTRDKLYFLPDLEDVLISKPESPRR